MAKTIKLPADLRDWKVTSFVGEDNGCEVYKVSRKIDKNTAQNAILRHAFVGKSNYTDEHEQTNMGVQTELLHGWFWPNYILMQKFILVQKEIMMLLLIQTK